MPSERRRPHPFALFLLIALVLAIAAAVLAPSRAPAVALYWNPIYRAEVALVVLAVAYLLGTTAWMAFQGQSFRRIELPGGAALERDTGELDAAAAGFDGFRESLGSRMDEVEAALSELVERVDHLEGRRDDEAGVP